MEKWRERVRQIWCDSFGFEPKVVASFDHLTVGLPSRILVGYKLLSQFDEAASIVLDTILPKREKPCGVSLELGLLPDKKCIGVVRDNVFFFRNIFNIPNLSSQLEERLGKIINLPKEKKQKVVDLVMRRLQNILGVWYSIRNSGDVLEARTKLFSELGVPVVVKQFFFSDLLCTLGKVLGVINENLNLLTFDKLGARVVNSDGTEGEILLMSPTTAEKIAQQQAIPTAPTIILSMIVAPGFAHYGNDYGMIGEISQWLNVSSPKTIAGDGENSWPVCKVTQGARTHVNALVDLLHFPWNRYCDMITESVINKKFFYHKFLDII